MSEKLIRNEQEAIETIKSNMPTSGYEMLRESLDMAISALEKQIPKTPKIKIQKEDLHIGRITFKAGTKTYWCPNCKNPITGTDKYCRHCGQAIDWE